MNELITSSLIWRSFVLLAAWLGRSWAGRLVAAFGRALRGSAAYRILARIFCAPDPAEGSLLRNTCNRLNLWLHEKGGGLRRLIEESGAYRLHRWIFTRFGSSRLSGRVLRGGVTGVLLFAIAAFAIIDFLLRDVLGIAFLASVWDELLIIASVCWLCLRTVAAKNPVKSRAGTMDVWLAFYMLAGLLLLWQTLTLVGINITGYRASMQYILLFFVVLRLLRGEEDLFFMYRVMVLIAFAIALHGIWQFVVGVEIPREWTDRAEAAVRTRVFSIFSNPNIMAAYMILFAPMAIGMAYTEKQPAMKVFYWFCGICMCLGCLFTMTRAAWMALAVAAVIFSLIVDRKLFALMLAAMVAACFLPFVRSRIGYLFTPEFAESNARAGRGKRWETGMGYLDEYHKWTFGLGYGIYGGAVAAQNPVNPNFDYMYVDNYYVKILVENGIVGLSVFLSSIGALLYNGVRSCAKSPYKPLCAGMLSGLAGILIHSYFESLWEEPYMMALFFAVAAMMIFAGFFLPQKAQGERSGDL